MCTHFKRDSRLPNLDGEIADVELGQALAEDGKDLSVRDHRVVRPGDVEILQG